MPVPGPRTTDAVSLLSEVAGDLAVAGARDAHLAWLRRIHGVADQLGVPVSRLVGLAHTGVATAAYGGAGLGLRACSVGFDRAAAAGLGAPLEASARGRFVTAAVNGLIGDRLLAERPRWAIPIAVRAGGRDVAPEAADLARAYPDAPGRLAVFVHGLCESETFWEIGRERTGTTYPEAVAGLGWAALPLRVNTGLPLRANGVDLASLLDRLVASWPVPVTRIALVGHSMGGLVIRAATAVSTKGAGATGWSSLVSDVITLGTPHLGAPIASGFDRGDAAFGGLPEAAALARFVAMRSAGVRDLAAGLDEEVPPLPHARYRLVLATLTASPRHPLGHVLGDLLVRPGSARGRDRGGRELFPGAEVLHLGRTGHFGLLNHPEAHDALRRWLA
ncbi:alpha/beta hydrolase [Nocardioides sp. GY 10113]|uniref:PGAP1-like alpha/beta domain-containing protein n=1 Tax=Nocardioides sp. GY 10113 TaxID=2569761 RepID=UPI0010A765E9|nr:alpha/beta hydrolase [Nocardioides sp. GY 10113]TIC86745.1 alpha/beta hydrolase [Nocardioides sp. GY 10113]